MSFEEDELELEEDEAGSTEPGGVGTYPPSRAWPCGCPCACACAAVPSFKFGLISPPFAFAFPSLIPFPFSSLFPYLFPSPFPFAGTFAPFLFPLAPTPTPAAIGGPRVTVLPLPLLITCPGPGPRGGPVGRRLV